MSHAFVVGEIALGNPTNRAEIFADLDGFPLAVSAMDEEVRRVVETQKMFGRGIGYIDPHLIASVQLTPGTLLWTRDKRMHQVVTELGLAFQEAKPD